MHKSCLASIGGDGSSPFSPEFRELFPRTYVRPTESAEAEELHYCFAMLIGSRLTDHSAIISNAQDEIEMGRARQSAIAGLERHVLRKIAKAFKRLVLSEDVNRAVIVAVLEVALWIDAERLKDEGDVLVKALIDYCLKIIPTLEAYEKCSHLKKEVLSIIKVIPTLESSAISLRVLSEAFVHKHQSDLVPVPPAPPSRIVQQIISSSDTFEHPATTELITALRYLSPRIRCLHMFHRSTPSVDTFQQATILLSTDLPAVKDWLECVLFFPDLKHFAILNRARGPHKLVQALFRTYVEHLILCKRCYQGCPSSMRPHFATFFRLILAPLPKYYNACIDAIGVLGTPFEMHEALSFVVPFLWDCVSTCRDVVVTWAEESPEDMQELRAMLRFAATEQYLAGELLAWMDATTASFQLVNSTLREVEENGATVVPSL